MSMGAKIVNNLLLTNVSDFQLLSNAIDLELRNNYFIPVSSNRPLVRPKSSV